MDVDLCGRNRFERADGHAHLGGLLGGADDGKTAGGTTVEICGQRTTGVGERGGCAVGGDDSVDESLCRNVGCRGACDWIFRRRWQWLETLTGKWPELFLACCSRSPLSGGCPFRGPWDTFRRRWECGMGWWFRY